MKIFILPGLTTVLIALFVDQVTKFFVMDNASSFATGIQILPIFDLVYVQNDGVSFASTTWYAHYSLSTRSVLK